jgi:hypothetical protein
MTSTDRLNDLMPTQKQEWVTPKISMMEATDTETKAAPKTYESGFAIGAS